MQIGVIISPQSRRNRRSLTSDSVDVKGGAGNDTAVAVDAAGTPHVGYRDYDNSTLKFARKVEGVWYRTQADASASVGSWVSIVPAPDGIHIAHRDSTNTALRHTQLVSGTITTEIVDNAANVGEYTDIAVAPNGTLHIAYRDASNAQLKEAYRLSGSAAWVTSIPDTVGSVGSYASVAVDRNGDVHLGYRNSSDTDTKYTNNIGKSLGTRNLPVTGAFEADGDVAGGDSVLKRPLDAEPSHSEANSTAFGGHFAAPLWGPWRLKVLRSCPS